MLIALNKFISKFAQHTLLFYRLLRKNDDFEQTHDHKKAFEFVKRFLATPTILTRSLLREFFYRYLVIIEEAVIFVLIRYSNVNQSLVYFISKALEGGGNMILENREGRLDFSNIIE